MQLLFSKEDYWVIRRALVDSNHADLERAKMFRDMPLGDVNHILAETYEQQAADTRRVMRALASQLGKPV